MMNIIELIGHSADARMENQAKYSNQSFYNFTKVAVLHKFTLSCFSPDELIETVLEMGHYHIAVTNYLDVICVSKNQISICDHAKVAEKASYGFGKWLVERFQSQWLMRVVGEIEIHNIILGHHCPVKLLAEIFSHKLICLTQMAREKMAWRDLQNLNLDRMPLPGYLGLIAHRTVTMLEELKDWFMTEPIWMYNEDCIAIFQLRNEMKLYITNYQVILTCSTRVARKRQTRCTHYLRYQYLDSEMVERLRFLPEEWIAQCDIDNIVELIVSTRESLAE